MPQYFGGITHWQNAYGIMPGHSPIRLDDATSRRAMVADSTLATNGIWGDTTQAVTEDLPVHGRDNSTGAPIGSNHVFADGSGRWVLFDKQQVLTSWWLPFRTLYFHQQDVPPQFQQ